jgi:hypothetical protein
MGRKVNDGRFSLNLTLDWNATMYDPIDSVWV